MFKKKENKIFTLLIFLLVFFSIAFNKVYSQNLDNIVNKVEERRAQLEKELAELEKEIAEKEELLKNQKQKSASLQRDIEILKTKIEKAKLDIKNQNLIIEKLNGEIKQKISSINELTAEIGRKKDSLSSLIKKTYELDNNTFLRLLLLNENFSDFYYDFDTFNSLSISLKDALIEVKTLKEETERQKRILEEKQNAEIDAKMKIEQIKKDLEKNQKEQNKLLNISKEKEKEYQKIVEERRKKAAQIRSTLFSLRDTAPIPFGKAYEYALLAEKITGIRPAFLLAIISQESDLGKNIGTCNRSFDPPEKKWRNIMKPSRDYQPYIRITSALGLDPDSMPLSCPYKGGYGGAMGPAQFLPSTWELYQSRVAKVLGISTPNPWEPKDAFIAAALLLSDLGASAQTYTSERTAALKYYAGGNWAKPSNAFYGNQVMEKAAYIQTNMIDLLEEI